MTKRRAEDEPYASALDLPSMVELLEQVRGLKTLTRFVARRERPKLLELEAQARDLATVIDAFYDVLGARHWIFHDSLSVEKVRSLLEFDADEAERRLISIYQDGDALGFMITRLRGLPAMRCRMDLIEKARVDYEAGRFYAVVLVLLSVMDGFVNDVQTNPRRGLHGRAPDEMVAWDSVVGHHMGLTRAHKTFVKSTFKTDESEVTELFRNGIVHGTIVNYDNAIVASKAWNRLFAVSDWARSLDARAKPPESQPTWRELFSRLVANAEGKRALEEWQPSSLTADDPGLASNEVCVRAREYLTAWQQTNYGAMASLISPEIRSRSLSQMAGQVRKTVAGRKIGRFDLVTARFVAAAVCEIDVEFELDGDITSGRMRWVRETADGSPATPNVEAEWFLYLWGPDAIINAAVPSNPSAS